MACPKLSSLRERLLSQDRPMQPTAEDLAHARVCPECKASLDGIARLEASLGTWVAVTLDELPPLPKVPLPAAPPHPAPPRWPWATVGTGVALLALLAGWMMSSEPGPKRSELPVVPAVVQPASPTASLTVPLAVPQPVVLARLSEGMVLARGRPVSGSTIPAGLGILRADRARLMIADAVELDAQDCAFTLSSGSVGLQSGTMVVRITRKGFPFQVETPHAAVGALGTVFQVIVTPDTGTKVSVSSGKVWVRPTGGGEEKVLLAPACVLVGSGGVILPGLPVPVQVVASSAPRPEPVAVATAPVAPEPVPPELPTVPEPVAAATSGTLMDTLWTAPEAGGNEETSDASGPGVVGTSPQTLLEGFQQ